MEDRRNHLVNRRALFTHFVILRLLSLDMVRSWMTAKVRLTLNDPYHHGFEIILVIFRGFEIFVFLSFFRFRVFFVILEVSRYFCSF